MFVFGAFVAICLWLVFIVYNLKNSDNDRIYQISFSPKKTRIIIHDILSNYFYYYNSLSTDEKRIFVSRVATFIKRNTWSGRAGLTITTEMKVLISASAIQLTFGLKNFMSQHFKTILVFPKEYYNRVTRTKHKGEVNINGTIVISWVYFLDGYNKPNDKVNLGLHEMAHVLDLSASLYKESSLNLAFNRFRLHSTNELESLLKGNAEFLRNYGAKNKKEFFAVLCETFFERPDELFDRMPELYQDMSILLNQSPKDKIYRNYNKTIFKDKIVCDKVTTERPIARTRFSFFYFIASLITRTLFVPIFIILLIVNHQYIADNKTVGIVVSLIIVAYLLFEYVRQNQNILIFNNKLLVEKLFINSICLDYNQIVAVTLGNIASNIVIYYYKPDNSIAKIIVRNSSSFTNLKELELKLDEKEVVVKY